MRKCVYQYKHFVLILFMSGVAIFQLEQIFKFQIYVQSDDFGYIANTVYFAGYNWNSYTGDITQYYNFGFCFPAAVIVKLVNNPVALYRGLLCYILILQLLLMYLVYRIEIDFLSVGCRKAAFISLVYILGAMAPQSGAYYMAEIPFALCCIGMIYLMLKIERTEGRKQVIYYVAGGILLAFTYTVHTRFLVLLIGTVVPMIFNLFFFGRRKKYALSFMPSFSISFFICRWCVKYIQSTLYLSTTGKDISGNDAITRIGYLPEYLEKILQLENFQKLFMNFLSLMGSMSLLTGGLVWIVIGHCFWKTYQILKEKRSDSISRSVLLVNSSGIICFFGMNLLIAWNGMMNSATEVRWLTAYRYGRPFIGIFILTGTYFLMEKKERKWICWFSLLGIIVSSLTMLQYSAMQIKAADKVEVSGVGWLGYYFYHGQDAVEYFCVMLLIMIVLYFIYMCCIYKKCFIQMWIVYLVFSVMLILSENQYNLEKTKDYYTTVDATYRVFQTVTFDNTEVFFHQTSYAGKLRYTLFNENLHFLLTEKECEQINYDKAALLSDRKDLQTLWGIEAYRIQLDEWEYLYTNDNYIIKQMANDYEMLHW